MALGRNDEATLQLSVGEIQQLLILAEDGFKALVGKVMRQLNDQSQPQEMTRPRPMAAAE